MNIVKPGTYFFETWSEATLFCANNSLSVDDIEAVYKTYKIIVKNT